MAPITKQPGMSRMLPKAIASSGAGAGFLQQTVGLVTAEAIEAGGRKLHPCLRLRTTEAQICQSAAMAQPLSPCQLRIEFDQIFEIGPIDHQQLTIGISASRRGARSAIKQCHLAESLSCIQTGDASCLRCLWVHLAENIDLALGNDVQGIGWISGSPALNSFVPAVTSCTLISGSSCWIC